MLALCLMLSVTYYAQNYAGIIGWSLGARNRSYRLLKLKGTQPDLSCITVNVRASWDMRAL